jgi:hypothetical protein
MYNVKIIKGKCRKLTKDEKLKHPLYNWVVTQEYTCIINEKKIVVPVNFLTDGATGGPDWGISWIFHDYLYATHCFDNNEYCNRKIADHIMYSILMKEGRVVYALLFWNFAFNNLLYQFSGAWISSGKRGPEFLQSMKNFTPTKEIISS